MKHLFKVICLIGTLMLMQTTAGGPPPGEVDDTVKSTAWVDSDGAPCTDVGCVGMSVAYENGCKVPCGTDDPECWVKFFGMADNRDYCELPPATMDDCATKLIAAIKLTCGDIKGKDSGTDDGGSDAGGSGDIDTSTKSGGSDDKGDKWGEDDSGGKCNDWDCYKDWAEKH